MKKIVSMLFCFVCSIVLAENRPVDPNPDPLNPYTICLGDKGHNDGHCSERRDGLGSACVDAAFLQRKDCYSQQPRQGL